MLVPLKEVRERKKRASTSRQRRRQRARRLALQRLELRLTLDASAVIDDGALMIQADDTGCDMQVVQEGENVCVISDGEPVVSLPAEDVDAIHFQGGSGDDVFANETDIPAEMYGGDGDDTLHGGGGDDELHGGDGRDALFGDAGADALFGDADDDYLDGGVDPDELTGGDGSDELVADSGDTSVFLADELKDVCPDDTTIGSSTIGSSTTPTYYEGADTTEEVFSPETESETLLAGNEGEMPDSDAEPTLP